MDKRYEYQKEYQKKHHEKIKETKRNSANALRRLEALVDIKEKLKPINERLKNIKKI